jgi:tRNA(fMet)-specific endonuclease VapC
LVDFDSAAAVEFQRLKQFWVGIGTMDLKIAAITLARGAMFLAKNRTDLEKVPGLVVQDWTA